MPALNLTLLDITGLDATTFLQGQLSQDVALWPHAQQARRAAWCTVKGRIWASFYLWPIDNGFRALVAQDLAQATVKRLRMYVLRSKVVITERSDLTLHLCAAQGSAMTVNADAVTVFADEAFSLAVSWADANAALAAASHGWEEAHIRNGAAWISQTTREQCVPQAVNYELVGGVNFKKGCYPGQEIVARSQYLGKLRRRAAIVQVAGEALPLMADVQQAGVSEPVGSVVLSCPGWALIECPLAALEAQLSVNGHALHVQPLPYALHDITA